MIDVTLPTREDLRHLATNAEQPTVSIYMPTHRTSRETRQDPIRLKNLLQDAEAQLEAQGHEASTRESLLSPARQIPTEVTDDFWREGNDGLVLFLQQDYAKCHKLPVDLPELAFASDHVYINPLLQYFQSDGHYYLLVVSQNSVRLLSGTKHSLAEVELETLPSGLRDALNIDEYQSSLQFHSQASPQSPEGAAIFHGHGGGEGEDRKQEILQYFHHLNRALKPFLAKTDAPLVFGGVEYLFPLFQKACDYAGLVDTPLTGNHDSKSASELHQPAWELIQPQFQQARKSAVERFGQAAAQGQATEDLEQIVAASSEGRIESLLLSDEISSKYDSSETLLLDVKKQGRESVRRLQAYSLAAMQTLNTSGKVFLAPPAEMPTESDAAAILRY